MHHIFSYASSDERTIFITNVIHVKTRTIYLHKFYERLAMAISGIQIVSLTAIATEFSRDITWLTNLGGVIMLIATLISLFQNPAEKAGKYSVIKDIARDLYSAISLPSFQNDEVFNQLNMQLHFVDGKEDTSTWRSVCCIAYVQVNAVYFYENPQPELTLIAKIIKRIFFL